MTAEFVTVRGWCALSGMGRTATFEAMRDGKLKAVKLSPRKVLIDVEAGKDWLHSLPRGARIVRDSSG